MDKYINSKSDFLGMKYGTARARLERQIMFNLAEKLGENICYRCGNLILHYKNFTIDHKEFWLGIDKDLFWKPDNIAFSHFGCNAKYSRYVPKPKRQIIDNKIKCTSCKENKITTQFTKGNRNGFQSECKKCRSINRRRARVV